MTHYQILNSQNPHHIHRHEIIKYPPPFLILWYVETDFQSGMYYERYREEIHNPVNDVYHTFIGKVINMFNLNHTRYMFSGLGLAIGDGTVGKPLYPPFDKPYSFNIDPPVIEAYFTYW